MTRKDVDITERIINSNNVRKTITKLQKEGHRVDYEPIANSLGQGLAVTTYEGDKNVPIKGLPVTVFKELDGKDYLYYLKKSKKSSTGHLKDF